MSSVGIDDLPPEILGHIFSYYVSSNGHKDLMDNLAATSRRWRDVAFIPYLWSVVDQTKSNLTIDDLVRFGERGFLSYVRRLKMDDSNRLLTPEKFTAIVRNCHYLTDLEVSGEFLKFKTSDISDHCHSLQKLRLINSPIYPWNCSCVFNVEKLQTGCPGLKEISLTNIKSVHCDPENTIGFPTLESLSCWGYGADKDVFRITWKSPHLRHLHVGSEKFDSVLKISCDVLESLELFFSQPGAHEVFSQIAKKWKRSLQRLVIVYEGARFLSSYGLSLFVDGSSPRSPPLKYVRLYRVEIDPLDFLIFLRNAENLEYLDIRSCSGLPIKYIYEFTGVAIQDLRESFVAYLEA